jgi:hypothetical protein
MRSPSTPSQPSRLAGGSGDHAPSPPTLTGPNRRFGAHAPRRRRCGYPRPRDPRPTPPLRGARVFQRGGLVGGRERKRGFGAEAAGRCTLQRRLSSCCSSFRRPTPPLRPHPIPRRAFPGSSSSCSARSSRNISKGCIKILLARRLSRGRIPA